MLKILIILLLVVLVTRFCMNHRIFFLIKRIKTFVSDST